AGGGAGAGLARGGEGHGGARAEVRGGAAVDLGPAARLGVPAGAGARLSRRPLGGVRRSPVLVAVPVVRRARAALDRSPGRRRVAGIGRRQTVLGPDRGTAMSVWDVSWLGLAGVVPLC